ncbi:MAG: hypothetical protein QG646_206 [Euryarchaeota archaeon]|nr:hypothetical protein [Euryarchaeota archaeon]
MSVDYFKYLKHLYDNNEISPASKVILDDYLLDIKLANLKQGTVDYHIKIMIFVTHNVEHDLDKLTVRDVKLFQEKLQNSHYSQSVQKVYTIGFRRFLKWYSKNSEYKNRRTYLNLLDSFVKRKYNIPKKHLQIF